VRQAIDGVLRFWFERGVAGFRIDLAGEMLLSTARDGEGEAFSRALEPWQAAIVRLG
jgi:glycosidase